MLIDLKWYGDLYYVISLYRRLLEIQDASPSDEVANALMIALSELGLSQKLIEENSLQAVKERMGHSVSEISNSLYDIIEINAGVPESVVPTLREINASILDKTIDRDFFYQDGGLNTLEIRSILEPAVTDKITKEPILSELKETLEMLIGELIVKIDRPMTDEESVTKFEQIAEDAELLEYLIRYFDLLNYDEDNDLDISLGEIKAHFDEVSNEVISGLEAYERVLNRQYLSDITGTEGWLETFKNSLKKAGDAIVNAIKSLVSFFGGQKKDLSARKADLIADCQKQVDALNALDKDKNELDTSVISRTKEMFEKANLPECAGYFSSVSDINGAVTAFNNAITWLGKNADNTADADKALSDAQSAADDVSKFAPKVTDESSSEEKAAAKEEKTTLITKAKELMATARSKLQETLNPMGALSKLPNIIKGSTKNKPSEDVAGTEAWML